MIIENKVTEQGDVLVIKPEIPIVGLIGLTQFVDTTVGENPTDYFKKEFRYSSNGGLVFSDWIVLNLTNIQNVVISKFDSFVIEYRYTRVGNAPDVQLEFNDILVSGPVESLPYPVYDDTYFNNFFNINDINVFNWAMNVLEKIFAKGTILPDFYERSSEDYGLTDEDFIAYWNSVTHFFAVIVYYARQFHNFNSNEILLNEFLNNKDIIAKEDSEITELLYLYQNYVSEYQKRGTNEILNQQENGSPVDGELIRLLNHKIFEELVFALFQNFESGWCLGKSSPTWKGTEKITNVRKGYEFTSEVKDLTKYPLINSSYISIVNGKMVISLSNGNSGVGYVDSGDDIYKITVDHRVDYEISFFVKQSAAINCLNFGCDAWSQDGNVVSLKKSTDGSNSSFFLQNFQVKKVGQYYWIRGVLWNSNKVTDASDKLNIGVGNNLIMTSSVNKIVPKVFNSTSGTASEVSIYNLVVRPRKLNFSRGQLGKRKLLYLLTINNNGKYSGNEIDSFIQDKLLPYDCFLKSNFIK